MIDLIIFILVNGALLAALIVAIEYYWFVGPIAGLFGAIFTLEIFRQGQDIAIRTFINASGELVYQTMPMGYFFYVPIILSLICLVAPIVKKVA